MAASGECSVLSQNAKHELATILDVGIHGHVAVEVKLSHQLFARL